MSQKESVELHDYDKSHHDSIALSRHNSDVERANEIEKVEFGDENQIPEVVNKNESASSDDTMYSRIVNGVWSYLIKMKGVDGKVPPHPGTYEDMFASVVISFVGILLISTVSYWFLERTFNTVAGTPVIMLIGSFGATAVLVFDAYTSPLAQPRNVMFSHLLASLIGVLVRLFGDATGMHVWIQGPLSVSLAIGAMRVFRCVHPPCGAVALIGVISGPSISNLGFGYVLICAGGAFISIAVAVLLNNLVPWRQYPSYWN